MTENPNDVRELWQNMSGEVKDFTGSCIWVLFAQEVHYV